MMITARAEYACLAMLELAIHHGDDKPLRLSEIAQRHDIPQRFLVQILLQMKAGGLVLTMRGASGGYQLAKSPDAISLGDILSVLDRSEEAAERHVAPSAMASRLQNVWKDLAKSRAQTLSKICLSDLIPKAVGEEYVI